MAVHGMEHYNYSYNYCSYIDTLYNMVAKCSAMLSNFNLLSLYIK